MLSRKAGMNHILDKIAKSRVLIRADFNVPIKNGVISNTKRIDSTIPTIKKALGESPKGVVLMSHLGRPNGSKVEKMSLRPVTE